MAQSKAFLPFHPYLHSKLIHASLIRRRPNTVFPGSDNSPRVKRILDGLVESHEDIVVPVVSLRNLVHESKVGAVFAPAMRRAVCNQDLDQLVGFAL